MKPREKVILIIVAIVAVLFLFNMLFGGESDEESAAKKAQARLPEIKKMVEQSGKTIQEVALNDTELYRVSIIPGEPMADPFLKRDRSVLKANTRIGDSRFTYYGYVSLRGKKVAIVNGEEFTQSQSIMDTGYTLVSIEPKAVIVQGINAKSKTLEQVLIPIQEDIITFSEGSDAN